MTIVVTGGGSGGHITPILAVAAELKQLRPEIKIVYVGQKGDPFADIPATHPAIDAVYKVRAGKFRRYHGEGLKQLLDVKTVALNLRDLLFIGVGLVQSFFLLRKLKPSVVFTRGGYVSVPVALGGKLNRVPYITHDSDAIPSLANRLIARWAARHAVALPPEVYPYPADKTIMTGVPAPASERVTPEIQARYKRELGFDVEAPLVLFTGGGNGARLLNELAINSTPAIVAAHPKAIIFVTAGRGLIDEALASADATLTPEVRSRLVIKDYEPKFVEAVGAADIVIARAGASTVAELANQAKASIQIPPKQLVWAVRNAETLAERNAVIALSEAQLSREPDLLTTTVNGLLADPSQRKALETKIHEFARPHAARDLAMVLLDIAK